MGETMPTNIPVEQIEGLVATINSQASNLAGTLNSLYQQCQADASFTGAAASKYGEFLASWHQHQQSLLEAINGAARVLDNLARTTRENDTLAAGGIAQ
jgi:uncharacterized protein YukE